MMSSQVNGSPRIKHTPLQDAQDVRLKITKPHSWDQQVVNPFETDYKETGTMVPQSTPIYPARYYKSRNRFQPILVHEGTHVANLYATSIDQVLPKVGSSCVD